MSTPSAWGRTLGTVAPHALALGSLLAGPAVAQRPLNLDFERAGVSYPDRPWGWTFGWSAFAAGPAATFSLDSAVRRAGARSLRIALPDSTASAEPQAIMLQLPSGFALGRDLRLTVWARARGAGTARMTLEAWRDREFAAADTAVMGGPREWTRHELAIAVPRDPAVHSVVVTLSLEGGGTAWFDDLVLEIDGAALGTLPPIADPPGTTELAWLGSHATPLRGVGVATDLRDDADLQPLADIIGTARIVGLGESTHGTREFFLVKHRILAWLVRDHGFRVFAIEANQLAVERVNRYVQTGEGTASDAMRVMFRVWNTDGMLDLVEWMRRWNAAHPDRAVRFAGYDMQDHRTPVDSLRAFVARAEPPFVRRLEGLTGEYRARTGYATPEVAESTRTRWHHQADTLWTLVSGRRAAWLDAARSRDDSVAVEWAVQAANLFRQAARFNVALSSPERDSLMAANLDWFLRTMTPGARAVLWAHDVHVSRGGDPELSFNGGAQMGAHLSRLDADRYRAISLLTYAGAYSATRSFTDHTTIAADAFAAPAGSVEAALHALARPAASTGWIVDLRPARTEPGGAWLMRPRPIRHIGYAAYDYGFEFAAVLPLEFDGVVFVDRTTPSRLLP